MLAVTLRPPRRRCVTPRIAAASKRQPQPVSVRGIFRHGLVIEASKGARRCIPCSQVRGSWQLMAKQAASIDDPDARAAFKAEVLPHADRLFRLAMWLERNRADAEDVVQDTMMQALRSFHRFERGTNCRAWLITILQRIVSNRRRARGRSIVVSDPDDRIALTTPFVPPIPQQLTDETVLGSLRRLPMVYQEVILLCDIEDLSYKEAAEALAIPIGTVMSRLHRGRAQLRSELVTADEVLVPCRPNGEAVDASDERIEAS